MCESIGYRAILACKPKLVTAIQLDILSITDVLVAEELINADVIARFDAHNELHRARQLVEHILNRVKVNPVCYGSFVEILSKNKCVGKDIRHILQTKYDELQEQGQLRIQGPAGNQHRNCAIQTESNDTSSGKFVCDLDGIPHKKSLAHSISNPIVCFKDLSEYNLEDLHAIMSSLTKKIKLEFNRFFDRIYMSFRESTKIDHQRLILTLRKCEPMFREDDFTQMETIHDVFELIQPHCSFFNYELLENLVQVCGADQDKKYLEEYTEHFSEYCKTMPCAEEVFGTGDAGPKRTKLIFKLDYEREELKPDNVKSIKENIAYHLGVKPSMLYLSKIKDGCILMEIFIPTFIVDQIFPLTEMQIIDLFTRVKVLHIENHINIEKEARRLLEAGKKTPQQDQLQESTDSELGSKVAMAKRCEKSVVQWHSKSSEETSDCRSSITLATVFADGKLFASFREFLKDQCITRNLNFWLACKPYRQQDPTNQEQLGKKAKAIYTKFIKRTAPERITIRPDTRRRIKRILKYGLEPLTVEIFNTAQKEVCNKMERNELQRFALSCSLTTDSSSTYESNRTYGSLQQSENTAIDANRPMGEELQQCVKQSLRDDNRGIQCRVTPMGQQRSKLPKTKPYLSKHTRISEKEFAALVNERLLHINDDREAMKQKIRDLEKKMGKQESEIMLLDWYDHPKSCKYIDSNNNVTSENCSSRSSVDSQEISRQRPFSPNSYAQQQLDGALKDYETINKVNEKKHSQHTVLDSGLGETIAPSEIGSDEASISSSKSNKDTFSPTYDTKEPRTADVASWVSKLPDHEHYPAQNKCEGDILVVYYCDDFPTPFAKRVNGRNFTLADFKTNVLMKTGKYRFFFRVYNEQREIELEEEYFDDSAILPLVRGNYIIGSAKKFNA